MIRDLQNEKRDLSHSPPSEVKGVGIVAKKDNIQKLQSYFEISDCENHRITQKNMIFQTIPSYERLSIFRKLVNLSDEFRLLLNIYRTRFRYRRPT